MLVLFLVHKHNTACGVTISVKVAVVVCKNGRRQQGLAHPQSLALTAARLLLLVVVVVAVNGGSSGRTRVHAATN